MASNAQTQFWYNFATIKSNAIYINRYHAKIEKTDRQISMFTAIAASSSIAGWLVWKDAWFIWTLVIAASQVLTAVKPYFPFKEQLRALSLFGPDLDGLALAAEEGWFAVSHGRLTDEEIHKQTIALKKKVQAAQSKAFKGMSLPDDSKLQTIAETEGMAYMTTIAGDEDEQGEPTEPADDGQEGVRTSAEASGRTDTKSLSAEVPQLTQKIGLPHDRQTTAENREQNHPQ